VGAAVLVTASIHSANVSGRWMWGSLAEIARVLGSGLRPLMKLFATPVLEAGLLLECEVHGGPPSARKVFRWGSLALVPISRTSSRSISRASSVRVARADRPMMAPCQECF
jgi:hypothetical protein